MRLCGCLELPEESEAEVNAGVCSSLAVTVQFLAVSRSLSLLIPFVTCCRPGNLRLSLVLSNGRQERRGPPT
jgi:hypothetical protein